MTYTVTGDDPNYGEVSYITFCFSTADRRDVTTSTEVRGPPVGLRLYKRMGLSGQVREIILVFRDSRGSD